MDHLQPLNSTPNDYSLSTVDFGTMRENIQTRLSSPIKESSTTKPIEMIEPEFNFDFEPQMQNFFNNPFMEHQSEEFVKAVEKKEEKIMITTSETDALYN
jgi:hypothetical protein